ncbi:hypothetical protein AQ475_15915 [Burkholderia thailandensis]|nr:hypothetical protein AQ475_15915 [Burkholderia thailandensis]
MGVVAGYWVRDYVNFVNVLNVALAVGFLGVFDLSDVACTQSDYSLSRCSLALNRIKISKFCAVDRWTLLPS